MKFSVAFMVQLCALEMCCLIYQLKFLLLIYLFLVNSDP